ncbi:unnamed protein product [Cylicostephanus goldi]|uniref:Uncharacterized protein n=1 Tax=Cylicostephanus goldi TaxID=71465 RepID=A0A3P7LTS8_CYLGO|nr:unnamed protein product [Cylicostephanus goldi]
MFEEQLIHGFHTIGDVCVQRNDVKSFNRAFSIMLRFAELLRIHFSVREMGTTTYFNNRFRIMFNSHEILCGPPQLLMMGLTSYSN